MTNEELKIACYVFIVFMALCAFWSIGDMLDEVECRNTRRKEK